MKIYKGQYGYSTLAISKQNGQIVSKCYMDVQFKKGTEPSDNYECDLFVRDKSGKERPCFITSYKKSNGESLPKLVIMGGDEKPVQTNVWGDGPRYNGQPIEEDDLPF